MKKSFRHLIITHMIIETKTYKKKRQKNSSVKVAHKKQQKKIENNLIKKNH